MSSPSPNPAPEQQFTREQLEHEHLQQEVAKLKLEVQRLRGWGEFLARTLGLLTALGAIVSIAYSIHHSREQQAVVLRQIQQSEINQADARAAAEKQFHLRQEQQERARTEAEKQRKEAEDRRAEELWRDAARPFWEAQLKLYLRASEAAALIATPSADEPKTVAESRVAAEREFWLLYWGPLAIVEDVGTKGRRPEIVQAMVAFGDYLRRHPDPTKRDRKEMERLSLRLAHAMRDAAGPSFNLTSADVTKLR